MSQFREDDDRDHERQGRDGRRDHDPRGQGGAYGSGPGQDREGWSAGASEMRDHLDSGGGDQGEDRYGHSGGFQSGYGGQLGKAVWGPLSQGSTYGQGGASFGHSGWSSHANPSDAPGGRGRGAGGDYGFRGQGGGGQQWGERSGGSYGQGDYGAGARRSQARRDQYGAGDREGFVAYGRGYGDARREPDEAHEAHGHDHDHEPGYRNWRDRQLASHDADYGRWRDEQARRYDEDYKGYRTSRHEAFSKGFDSWRTTRDAQPGGAPVDQAVDTVSNVTDGGSGRVHRDHDDKDADKTEAAPDRDTAG